MTNVVDLKPVLAFLIDLERNNDRTWFGENHAAYELARAEFESFVDLLIGELGVFEDLAGVTARDCIFRIYRDVRFSRDKSPYKTHMSAAIAPGGKKWSRLPYYIQIAPDGGSLIAGGLHMPNPAQLAKFREAIARDAGPLKAVIDKEEFKRYFGAVEGEKVKTVPQGYSRDHPEIELLRLKEAAAVHHLSDEAVLSADFAAYVVKVFATLKPFLDYLNATLG